jgi:hypothetical protein
MQTEVCLHILGTSKKNPEQSRKLGHDCIIPHPYQFITHYCSVIYRMGQTSVVRFVKCTSKYVAKSFHYSLFNTAVVNLWHHFTNVLEYLLISLKI